MMSELHPEMAKFLGVMTQAMSERGMTDLHSQGIAAARALLEAPPPPETLPPIHRVENRTIPGPAGQIPIRIYRPSDDRGLPVLVWFHGGGWVLGTLDGSELNCRNLANDVGCVVLSVDYRLAPENPFPAAIDDCTAATAWVAVAAAELGIDPLRIAVGGDSAGGNLAACVAYDARERGQPLAMQLLVYPTIDADFARASHIDKGEGYFLTSSCMQWLWDCYVPDPAQRQDPRVSPIHAASLSGLARAWIITAEFDPLRDEGEAYGWALATAGVVVETRRYDGMVHGFFNMPTEQPVEAVQSASREATAALRRAFGLE